MYVVYRHPRKLLPVTRVVGLCQAVVEHAGLLHFAGCSMHDANDSVAIQTEGALARLQERLEEREACFAVYV